MNDPKSPRRAAEAPFILSGPLRAGPLTGPAPKPGWQDGLLETVLRVQRDATAKRAAVADASEPAASAKPLKGRKRLEAMLAAPLAALGYVRCGDLAYRADWSAPGLDHMLYFELHGTPKTMLTGDAGVRNPRAESFAQECGLRYLPKIHAEAISANGWVRPPWWCYLDFGLGGFFGGSGYLTADASQLGPEQVERTIIAPIRARVVPPAKSVDTLKALYALVVGDEPPYPWFRAAPIARPAILAYLANVLGIGRTETAAELMKHVGVYKGAIDEARFTPESFVEALLDDAVAAVRADRTAK